MTGNSSTEFAWTLSDDVSNTGYVRELSQQKSVNTPAKLAQSRGDLLRRLRMRRQISQNKLAKKAGMSSSAVQQIEADMREGPGTYPANAASLLRVLDAMEPLTDQELAEYVQHFPVREEDVQQVLSVRRAASLTVSKSPEERVRIAVDVLIDSAGLSYAADALESIALLVHESARVARERATGKREAAPIMSRRKALVRTLDRDGMRIEERIPISESGSAMHPVPAGHGLVDDPDLALADAAKAAESELRSAARAGRTPNLTAIADVLAAARARAGA